MIEGQRNSFLNSVAFKRFQKELYFLIELLSIDNNKYLKNVQKENLFTCEHCY